jgi:hypothetical protein
MLDDIGLGKAIADTIYLIIIVAGICGFWLLIKRKKTLGAIFWTSLTLNVLFYLFFMGKYSFYPKTLYLAITSIWPLVNLGLFCLLLFNLFKNKHTSK